ncbi:MAG: class I SAM-dependent methyltransferase [Candidatus Firestonebacteria bacterium]|nr:class I SAM-dependent methyltransferase [Candidatus Firestonebacteria bacterium]
MPADYAEKIKEEISRFKTMAQVHDLPAIFHYCAEKYWLPKFKALGFEDVNDVYLKYIARLYPERSGPLKIISIGAGNADLEINLGTLLRRQGLEDWEIHCLDVNPHMLERGRAAARATGMAAQFSFLPTDIQKWEPSGGDFDVVLASHSLHHFMELELLFEKIHHALKPRGYFLTNDMIGRNGHMRWPEALAVLEVLWQTLDDKYKYNHHSRQVDYRFVNMDCSTAGFEGIRAQDILPLCVQYFSFDLFLGFGNVVDIFVDRVYGHNFDPASEKDRYIIDVAAALDEFFIDNGFYKPTHMVAAMMRRGAAATVRCHKQLTPEFCIYPATLSTPTE